MERFNLHVLNCLRGSLDIVTLSAVQQSWNVPGSESDRPLAVVLVPDISVA